MLIDQVARPLCTPELRARRKDEVLVEIATLCQQHEALANVPEQTLVGAFREREALGSTGFGNGVAIPHCRLPDIDVMIVGIAVSRPGVEFDAVDGRKVHLLCFLIGPDDQPDEYVKTLAEISKILASDRARRELTRAPSRTALYEGLLRHAAPSSDTSEGGVAKLLVLVLQDEELLTSVMELFVEMGLQGASVIESQSMGRLLTAVPLFASFMNFLGGREEFHRTVLAVVPETQLDRVVAAVEEITGDLDRRTGACVLVVDLPYVKGSLQAI